MDRVPIDAVAFVVIAAVTVAIREPFLHHSVTFSDARFFHFGRRALHGDVPYRDYVFQVGLLPIYVDVLFQKLFGTTYMASLYASLFIHVLRLFVLWALVRRLTGWRPAALLAVFGVCDAFFGWCHHWSWAYAQLFLSTAGLCFVAATAATSERRVLVWLALAGFSMGANAFAPGDRDHRRRGPVRRHGGAARAPDLRHPRAVHRAVRRVRRRVRDPVRRARVRRRAGRGDPPGVPRRV
jgi:hypothetical protein